MSRMDPPGIISLQIRDSDAAVLGRWVEEIMEAREKKIDRIVAVLKKREDNLSDGYKWYAFGDWEDSEKAVEITLRKIAGQILDEIKDPK